MRRHIAPLFSVQFDSRASSLLEEFRPEWSSEIRRQHQDNIASLVASLSVELGPHNILQKIQDFKDIGVLPFSIISHHNNFLGQIRAAFVQGLYYPSLTGSCALGERILNHLILDLRDEYVHRPSYKKVATRNSFMKWQQLLHVLNDWGVLEPGATAALKKLESLRNKSLHFNKETYARLRDDALSAIALLGDIIESQFAVFGSQPWFIPGTAGACFIGSEWERNPFVRKYYLPICPRVGVRFSYSHVGNKWRLFDFKEYEDRQIDDLEFCKIFNERDTASLAPIDYPPAKGVVCYEVR